MLHPCLRRQRFTMLHSDKDEQPASGFSAALRADVTSALATYLSGSTPATDARLHDIARRVCTEAHERDLSLDLMLQRMEELLRRVPRFAGDSEQREKAFEVILSACRGAFQK